MAWFLRSKNQNVRDNQQREMPDGLWMKCDRCGEVLYRRQLEESLYTCSACDNHFRIPATYYIQILFDPGTFVETDAGLRSPDPLQFVDTKPYKERIAAAEKTGLAEAITIGKGAIDGIEVSFGAMNFGYIAGSMGSVVGEKIARAIDRSLADNLPLILISTSGGARMQEAAISLMQMAKTSAKLAQLAEAEIPYISILTDPTTGGVSASFAMVGDVNIAEPNALIGFAGPRVIEQTIRKKLPPGFQRSEFLLEHGFLDKIVHRRDLRDVVARLLGLLQT